MPFDLLTGESAVMFARKKLKRRKKDNLQGAERKHQNFLLLKIFYQNISHAKSLFISLELCGLT